MQRRTLDIILVKTYSELKAEAQRTYVGVLWWIIEPIMFMSIFYFVFGLLFARNIENFVAFLLIGLSVWQWFNSTATQSAASISANIGLMNQVRIPTYVFPMIVVLTNLAKFAVIYLLLLIFLALYGIEPSWIWLESMLVLLCFLAFITATAVFLASIVPLLPDVRILVDNLFRGLFFLSGIFYDIRSLPDQYAAWLNLNPMVPLISNLRGTLMDARHVQWIDLTYVFALSGLLFAIGLSILRYNQGKYPKIAF